jgi:hypothetical protein
VQPAGDHFPRHDGSRLADEHQEGGQEGAGGGLLVPQQANDPDNNFLLRKLCYLPTCYYCFSHYVTLFFLLVTRYQLLQRGWRGYLISFFAVTWVADVYMVLFRHLVQP